MADNETISRLKVDERKFFERPTRKGNSGDIMKEKNTKRKLQDKTPLAANIRIYVSNEDERTTFFNKMGKAKLCVDEKNKFSQQLHIVE